MISGGAAQTPADPLPADGKTLPPAPGVATDHDPKTAVTGDAKPASDDADPLLSILMPDGTVPAPAVDAGPAPSPAPADGSAAVAADAADRPVAPVADSAVSANPALPITVPPPAAPVSTSSSDPASPGTAPSAPSPIAATVPAPSPATPSASTTPEPVVDAAAGTKAVEGHLRAEQVPAQSARTDAPLSQPMDNSTTARDTGSQGGNSQGGQTPLQEILAKIGGADGTTRGNGDSFRTLLQGADSGATGNTGALVYSQPGAGAGPGKDTAVPSLPVHTPLRHPEWSDEVSQRVRWVIGNQVQSAELKINPPQLGPIEVRVSVDSDQQMTVTLSSQHALVRETLQDSAPRLRDLMSEHGFSGVNVDVSQHSSSDGRKPAAQANMDPAIRPQADSEDAGQDITSVLHRGVRGIVDFYA
jgi:flagellar hook-length control protein FliK